MSDTKKLLESIQSNLKEENLKESITIEDAENFAQRLDSCEDMDDIQRLINEIPDGVLENEVQSVFDQCDIDGDDIDTVKSLISTTFEDNAEYLDESNVNDKEDKSDLQSDIGDINATFTDLEDRLTTPEAKELMQDVWEILADKLNELGDSIDTSDIVG